MATPVRISNTNNLTSVLTTKNKEEELMHDVMIIVENLACREEATIKLIFDRLYDVGSIHLIQQRFRHRIVHKPLRWIARMSKPVFRVFAWRWFKRNCPLLITRWLYQQVSFRNRVRQSAELVIEKQLPPVNTFSQLPDQSTEVKFLRSQVKLLSGILIGVIAVFGGSLIWLSQNLVTQRSPLQTIQPLPQLTIQEASVDQRN